MDQQLGFFDSGFAIENVAVAPVLTQPTGPNFARAIDALAEHLREDSLNEKQLVAITREHDIEDIQDAYNALEGAVVSLVRETPTLAFAKEILDRLPAQRRRSEAKEELQQFSTPPHLALLAQQLAAITDDDFVLEPSAGTGLMVSTVKAQLHVNEYDRTRRNVLRAIFAGATVTAHDARFIDAFLKGSRPTVVMMNPPFSNDLSGANGREVGLDHVRAAIRAATPGARIVALLGDNQHPERVDWKPVLDEKASIRLALSIDGRDYYRMGTTFGVCLVVIDKGLGLECLASSTQPQRVMALGEQLPQIPRQRATRLTSVAGTRSISSGTAGGRAFVAIFNDVVSLNYRYERPTEQEEVGRFVRYASSVHVDGAKPHPGKLVESRALGGVALPPVAPEQVPVKLTQHALDALSDVQLETLVYIRRALQRNIRVTRENDKNEKVIADVSGGILMGHGTGFGKGRENAAVILSEMLEGNRIALYFSENQDLFEDFLRDWSDVVGAQYAGAVHNLSSYHANDHLGMKSGIIYSTYATLRVKERQNTRSRVDQLVASVGEDFAGVVVLDECHNLANAIGGRGTRGKIEGSQQGFAALELQRRLPRAKFIYVSATCASTVEAYAYAERLGLWGPEAPFESRGDFMQRMNEGGVGALEMLTRDLKAQGLYVATSLSMEGVDVERLTHILTPDQVDQYNAVAKAWRIIYERLDDIINDREYDNINSRSARAAIASARQRSLQAMLGSLAMPTIIADQRKKLEAGCAIVGQLTNTYEAAQEKALATVENPDDLETVDVSPRQTMLDYLDRTFPVAKTKQVSDGERTWTEIIKDDNGQIVVDPELVAIRDDLKAQIGAAIMPDSILTIMLDEYGTDNTAEITGRKRRLVRKVIDGVRKRIVEKRSPNANIDETQAFMNGPKRVLLFSEAAGGTGRSYNASLACTNQARRAHYLLQTGWRSDRACQGFGRTLRSNSANDPYWIMCETNAPGQKRFISTIARRLEMLGAASRGQRDAASTGLFSEADNLETSYGAVAVNDLLMDIAYRNTPLSYETWLEQTNAKLIDNEGEFIPKEVPHFLNYVLCCDLGYSEDGPQNVLMDALVERIEQHIERAKANKTYDFGLQTMQALKIERDEDREINVTEDGVKTQLTTLLAYHETKKFSFSKALSQVRASRQRYGSGDDAYFAYDNEGRICSVYRTANLYIEGVETKSYSIGYPDHIEHEQRTLPAARITDEEAVDVWQEAFDNLSDTYTHKHYLVTGATLPIMRLLPQRLHATIAMTDAGERVLGAELELSDVNRLLNALELDAAVTNDDAYQAIKSGKAAVYDGGTVLVRQVNFSGEKRVEITVPRWHIDSYKNHFSAYGVVVERVNYETRFFLPHNDELDTFKRTFEKRQLSALK